MDDGWMDDVGQTVLFIYSNGMMQHQISEAFAMECAGVSERDTRKARL